MKVVFERKAVKGLERLNEPLKSRLAEALKGLEKEPPEGDIKRLVNREDYRLRVDGYHALYRIERGTIFVTNIVPCGQAYKGS